MLYLANKSNICTFQLKCNAQRSLETVQYLGLTDHWQIAAKWPSAHEIHAIQRIRARLKLKLVI